jgi:hypothetical protein
MKISAYATHESYWRHLQPIVDELRARGVEVACWSRRGKPWGPAAYGRRSNVDDIVLTASWVDAREWRDRVVVYVEHGAGQTYSTKLTRFQNGYAGGGDLEHVELFLCPSERVAELWRARYIARAEVVGSPALDGLSSARHDPHRARRVDGNDDPSPRPLVAFTCHWRMGGDELPEGMPALPLYLEAIAALEGVDVLGHAHPRIRSQMEREYSKLGIPFEPDPDVVLSSIDLLVADNTSLMYEAAALDVPVLALNAPFYRRDVEHGLRFWQFVPGLQCDEPAHLASSIDVALRDGPVLKRLRARAARAAYDLVDGRAAARAADAVLTLEGATMQKRVRQGQEITTPTEVSGRWNEVEERLYALGATDELVDDMRAQWGKMTTAQQDRIRRLNDVLLRREIVLALRAADSGEELDEPDPEFEPYSELPSEDEIDEAASALLDKTDEGEILEALGTDVDLADRLFRLELAREGSRDGLLEAFAAVAGFQYDPGDGIERTAVEAEVDGEPVEISGDGNGTKLPPAPPNYEHPEVVVLDEDDEDAEVSAEVANDSESVTGDVESDEDDDDVAELEDDDDDE